MQVLGEVPSPVLLEKAAQGPPRGVRQVPYVQGDRSTPTRGLQLKGGSPRPVCQEGPSCIFSPLANDEQELLLRQHGAIGSLQQHLHRGKRRCSSLGWENRAGGSAGAELSAVEPQGCGDLPAPTITIPV